MEQNLTKTNESCDPLDVAIEMYKSHLSIKLIKQKTEAREKFPFQQASSKKIEAQLSYLDPTKSSTFGSIPVKSLAEHSDLFAPMLHFIINDSVDTSNFPNELKIGDMTSLFKKSNACAKRISGL